MGRQKRVELGANMVHSDKCSLMLWHLSCVLLIGWQVGFGHHLLPHLFLKHVKEEREAEASNVQELSGGEEISTSPPDKGQ